MIDGSFIAQHALMKLASNRINTSWVAGTFNEDDAEKRFQGYKIPAVIAYGIEKTDKSFFRKMLTMVGSRTSRLPFEQLFYDIENKQSITEKDFDPSQQGKVPSYPPYMKDFLEAVRLGPSALNQQPWRFVLNGKEVHVIDTKVNGYSQFDIGIALANLDLLKEIRGGSCTFEVKKKIKIDAPFSGKYIITAIYQE